MFCRPHQLYCRPVYLDVSLTIYSAINLSVSFDLFHTPTIPMNKLLSPFVLSLAQSLCLPP